MSTVTKISMISTSRIVEYFIDEDRLEEAMDMSKGDATEIHIQTLITKDGKAIDKTAQVWLGTNTKEEREAICDKFNLRRTSHLSNREEVIYVLNFPFLKEETKDGAE